MSYLIDGGIWSSVFAVPTAVVDEHIKMCSPLSLKILLVMLRHAGTPVDAAWLSEKLNLPVADISDALGYWVGAGIVSDCERPTERVGSQKRAIQAQTGAPVHIDIPPAPCPETIEKVTGEGQRIITTSSRRKLSRDDVAALAATDLSVGELLREAQSVLGAPLTPVESESLAALRGYYGFDTGAVLMLLQYCVSIGRKSMSYVEKAAAAWQEHGILTHEQAEQEILRLTRNNADEKKVMNAFGVYNRTLTSKEKDFVESWYRLGLDEHLIFLACERAVENTGKVSFAYADKILSGWKTKGISTIREAMDELASGGKRAAAKNNPSAQTGRDSSIDKNELRASIHREFIDK